MISQNGASLIATVYPIAILLIVVEARSLPRQTIKTLPRAILKIIEGVATIAAVLGSTLSVLYCVTSVSANVPIRGGGAVIVFISGFLLMIVSFFVVGRLLSQALDHWDFEPQRGNRRGARRERR